MLSIRAFGLGCTPGEENKRAEEPSVHCRSPIVFYMETENTVHIAVAQLLLLSMNGLHCWGIFTTLYDPDGCPLLWNVLHKNGRQIKVNQAPGTGERGT